MGPKQEQVSLSLHIAERLHHSEHLCEKKEKEKERKEEQ
jgi:hypothetical protein